MHWSPHTSKLFVSGFPFSVLCNPIIVVVLAPFILLRVYIQWFMCLLYTATWCTTLALWSLSICMLGWSRKWQYVRTCTVCLLMTLQVIREQNSSYMYVPLTNLFKLLFIQSSVTFLWSAIEWLMWLTSTCELHHSSSHPSGNGCTCTSLIDHHCCLE